MGVSLAGKDPTQRQAFPASAVIGLVVAAVLGIAMAGALSSLQRGYGGSSIESISLSTSVAYCQDLDQVELSVNQMGSTIDTRDFNGLLIASSTVINTLDRMKEDAQGVESANVSAVGKSFAPVRDVIGDGSALNNFTNMNAVLAQHRPQILSAISSENKAVKCAN